jgi:hypothetical protein
MTRADNRGGTAMPFFEKFGEGYLGYGSSGQGLDALTGDPLVVANRPKARSGFDTAHLACYQGTDLFQWYGRGSSGYFYPHGDILRITDAGMEALKASIATAEDYNRPYRERAYAALAKARGDS